MEIRFRDAGDMEALTGVASLVHAADSYPIYLPGGDFRRFLDAPVPVAAWVAVDGGEVVGHVALNDSTSRPTMELVQADAPPLPPIYVARLLVAPSSRRQGIGEQLLDHARRAALDARRSPYLDVVDVATAIPAIKLYQRQGWTEVGRVRFDLAGDQVEEVVFRGPPN